VPLVDVMSARLVTAAPDDSVEEAIARMLAERVGAVVVSVGSRLVGIFTERDVLRLAGRGARLADIRLADVMTSRVVTAAPEDDLVDVARVMRERNIRHVPVVQGENVLGVVGIRDLLGALVERLWRLGDEGARETVHELLLRRPYAAHDETSSSG
jgi:CBS domain-containing protein